MRNKSILTILIIVLAILFLTSSCSFFGWKIVRTEEQSQPPAGIAADSLEGEQYANCINKCSSCESTCKDNAYLVKATADENKNMCANIISSSLQSECQQTIIATEAVSQLNKDKCLQLTEEGAQQSCLVHVAAEVAIQSNSVDKCNDASDVERCKAIFYKDMAVSSGDMSFCDKIRNSEQQAVCQEVASNLIPSKEEKI